MPVYYLLECPCGEKVPVTASQAGQNVRCSCGKELEVPTLLKLKQLETIEETPTKRFSADEADSPSNWGAAQGLITIGVLSTLLAVGWLVYVISQKPPKLKEVFTDQFIEQRIDQMNLLETYKMWNQSLRYNIRQKMTYDRQYLAAMKVWHIRLGVAVVLVVAGICLLIVTTIFARRTMARAGTRQ